MIIGHSARKAEGLGCNIRCTGKIRVLWMLSNADESYVTSRQNDDWNKIRGSVWVTDELKNRRLSAKARKTSVGCIARLFAVRVTFCNLNIFVLFVDPMFLQDEPVRADAW